MTALAPAVALALALSAAGGTPLDSAAVAQAPRSGRSDAPPARPPFPPEIVPGEPPGPAAPARPEATTRRYQIERIQLAGLSHVRESEVRRRLLVAEGEILDEERVLLSRLTLLQLGWFSRVETRVERGSERGLVVLVFDVTERNTLLITDLIVGSTGPQPIYGGFGLSQQNFLGRGFGLSGAFVYGGSPRGRPQDPDRFAVRGSFFAPDVVAPMVRRGLVFGLSAFFARGEEFTCPDPECEAFSPGFGGAPIVRYQRAAGEVTVGLRPGAFERLHATYRFEHLRSWASGTAVPGGLEPYVLPGSSDVSAITGTYEVDTRDDFFFPREGFRALGQVTFGSRLLGGDYEYSRYLLNLDTGFWLLRKTVRFQAALGAAQGNAPFFERFYGADYSYFAIGPALGRALELNFSTDSRYDAFLAMVGLEHAVPVWSADGFFKRGYLALGVRGVYSTATLGGGRTRFSKTPVSAELALRFDTPVGVFNASLAYLLDNIL